MGMEKQDPSKESNSNVDTSVSQEQIPYPTNSTLDETSPQNNEEEEFIDDKKRNTAYRLYDIEYHLRLASTLEPKKIKLYINIIDYLLARKGKITRTAKMIHEFKSLYNNSTLFGEFEIKHPNGKVIRNPEQFKKYYNNFKGIIKSLSRKNLLETKNTNTGKQIIIIKNPERLEELQNKLTRIFDDKTEPT